MSGLVRQHLIDPEICIRCETCAEMCQQDAISYDGVNVVVDYSLCTYSMDCIAPCPTGAIDSWVMVESPFSTAEQFGWDELPAVSAGDKEDAEIVEALSVALIVGGSIVIPHLRRAVDFLDELNEEPSEGRDL